MNPVYGDSLAALNEFLQRSEYKPIKRIKWMN